MKSSPVTIRVLIVDNMPHIGVTADINIGIANRKDPFTLQVVLEATECGAIGSA